jgi:hypothetical protein
MDDLAALRTELEEVEARLATEAFVALRPVVRDGRTLHVVLTRRFHRLARRARLWRSTAVLVTLKNAGYGFDPAQARSVGGRDGIFLLDRTVDGPMTRKVYERFLDRHDSGAAELAAYLGATPEQLQAVRLVSHHLRLLGVLHRRPTGDWLAIVDFERREH